MPRSIDNHRPDCPCDACRGRRGLAKANPNDNKLTVRLRPDVIDWLRLQPDGPARAIEHLVDQAIAQVHGLREGLDAWQAADWDAAQPDPRR